MNLNKNMAKYISNNIDLFTSNLDISSSEPKLQNLTPPPVSTKNSFNLTATNIAEVLERQRQHLTLPPPSTIILIIYYAEHN
ncbi:MAG: hypothetical protein N5P05_004464 (plasmid) [Chroococcopsis gigantea SAG 12.99]|nr:hypothetical protein [Chroococcopsis gigantea SAG 12.99]